MFHADTPDPPYDPKAVNIQNESGCIILMVWSPPVNSIQADVDYYIVEFLSGNIETARRHSRETYLVYVHNCTQNMLIRLRAVNRCGSISAYSQEIKPVMIILIQKQKQFTECEQTG